MVKKKYCELKLKIVYISFLDFMVWKKRLTMKIFQGICHRPAILVVIMGYLILHQTAAKKLPGITEYISAIMPNDLQAFNISRVLNRTKIIYLPFVFTIVKPENFEPKVKGGEEPTDLSGSESQSSYGYGYGTKVKIYSYDSTY